MFSTLENFLKKDLWFSGILGKDAYSLNVPPEWDDFIVTPEGVESIGRILKTDCFIFSKVATERIKTVWKLEELGFRLVDTNMTFEKYVSDTDSFISLGNTIRQALPEDSEKVEEIAKNSFIFSRFHLDPNISGELANKIKAGWAKNYFKGERGDNMLVSETDGEVSGFCQILERGDNIVIDLIASDHKFRRKGIGSDIISHIPVFYQEVKKITVGTQAANIPSMRLYEKNGFRLIDSKYIFHYHGHK